MEKALERMEREAAGAGGGEVLEGFAIQPPNLEDAGLEDCALPPDSIMEAFSRAASSLKARLVIPSPTLDHDEGNCVQDPGPTNGGIPDKLLGIGTDGGAPACGDLGPLGDDVVVAGAGDRVVVLGGDERSCCPDSEGDAVGGDKKEGVNDNDNDDEKPILVEA